MHIFSSLLVTSPLKFKLLVEFIVHILWYSFLIMLDRDGDGIIGQGDIRYILESAGIRVGHDFWNKATYHRYAFTFVVGQVQDFYFVANPCCH